MVKGTSDHESRGVVGDHGTVWWGNESLGGCNTIILGFTNLLFIQNQCLRGGGDGFNLIFRSN